MAFNFWSICFAAVIAVILVTFFIKETLPVERRQPFHLATTLRQFVTLFRAKRVFFYILASGFLLQECSLF